LQHPAILTRLVRFSYFAYSTVFPPLKYNASAEPKYSHKIHSRSTNINNLWTVTLTYRYLRPYSKSHSHSCTLNEWKFNLSFSRLVWLLFLDSSWRVSVVPYYMTTHPPAVQKQHWHSREAQIEPPLIECEWAFRIQALVNCSWSVFSIACVQNCHSMWIKDFLQRYWQTYTQDTLKN
jgi:hypothetical protein